MTIGYGHPAPKPSRTRKQLKAKRDREEAKVEKAVRAECVKRDGYCRYGVLKIGDVIHPMRAMNAIGHLGAADVVLSAMCDGPSEWAHLEDTRRARTMKMRPELRHHTKGTMMLCRKHHAQYDARLIRLRFVSAAGADGPLEFYRP